MITGVLNRRASYGDPIYVPREPITMFGLALFVFVRQELNQYIRLVTKYQLGYPKTQPVHLVFTKYQLGYPKTQPVHLVFTKYQLGYPKTQPIHLVFTKYQLGYP